ncbi:pentatricopeptide repeat-containing protein At2g13600 [Amborella trichopoda]|uniref:pentatricopeptide repeat-containing protein At2g13600 n=1 Tax=Amborella trichopoda TaxID=13333 RepID=UPI0009C0FD65|nr:pentatricopeptide repeat-containing protein At2g13600 [Amborella trichopoda]|eukprot:XP_011626243.2 pentatricopeptide repeat-containing protein At2g13600 [Amborella trichopoda]
MSILTTKNPHMLLLFQNRSLITHLSLQQQQREEEEKRHWSQLITQCARSKQHDQVLHLFYTMHRSGLRPSRNSTISSLNACSHLCLLPQGTQLHALTIKAALLSPPDVVVSNVLIDMYSKCGLLDESHKIFDETHHRDLVSWISILSGYSRNGLHGSALETFFDVHSLGMGFSDYGFSVAFKACAALGDIRPGLQIHCLATKVGLDSDVFVVSSLLDMYAKCGRITSARHVFNTIDEPNVVSWTSMISGYVRSEDGEEALRLFSQQLRVGIAPDPFTFSSVLAACASLSALDPGQQVHVHVLKSGLGLQLFAGNSLIDMYAKCGCLSDATRVHAHMQVRDVVSWTGMINGCASHGHGLEALRLFTQMKSAGIRPNAVTLVCVLSACSHSGLVKEGLRHFHSMRDEYGIEPTEEHFTCVVDLLGRAGLVKEAEEFMRHMPCEPSASAWGALLSACRKNGNVHLSAKCADQLFRLEPHAAANHVQLANIYAASGRWKDMGRVRLLMKEKGIKKESSYSWIEMGKKVNVFGVGDNLHPKSDVIYFMLGILAMEMKDQGYIPTSDHAWGRQEKDTKP